MEGKHRISSSETYRILKDILGDFVCGSYLERNSAPDLVTLAVTTCIEAIKLKDPAKVDVALSLMEMADKKTLPGINRCGREMLKKMTERGLFPANINLHEEGHRADCLALGIDPKNIVFAVCVTTFIEGGELRYYAEPGIFVENLVVHLRSIFQNTGFDGLIQALKVLFPKRIIDEDGASAGEIFNAKKLQQL